MCRRRPCNISTCRRPLGILRCRRVPTVVIPPLRPRRAPQRSTHPVSWVHEAPLTRPLARRARRASQGSRTARARLASRASRTALCAHQGNPTARLAPKDSLDSLDNRDNRTARRALKASPDNRGNRTVRLAPKDKVSLAQNHRKPRSRSVRSPRKRKASAKNSRRANAKTAAENCSAAFVSRAAIGERLHHRQIDEAHGGPAVEYFNDGFLVIGGLGEKDVFHVALRVSVVQRKPA
jgi:hypothetical protein